jgi:hypothetical protein
MTNTQTTAFETYWRAVADNPENYDWLRENAPFLMSIWSEPREQEGGNLSQAEPPGTA